MKPAFIQWFNPKSHTQGILNWRRVLRTHLLMFSSIWYEVIIGFKAVFWPYFMFIKVRNYLAPNFITEDFRIQVRDHPANYVYGCHMTPVTRGALGYVYHQKNIIQGHFVYKYATRKAPSLYSRVVFRAVLSLDVSTQTVFLCYMSVKYTLRGYFCFFVFMLRTGCFVNRWNQYDFSTVHWLYIWGHRWILALLLIFVDWYKNSKTNIGGSKCILNRFWCIIWGPNAIFHQNIHITCWVT